MSSIASSCAEEDSVPASERIPSVDEHEVLVISGLVDSLGRDKLVVLKHHLINYN